MRAQLSIRPATVEDAATVLHIYVDSANAAWLGRQPPMDATPDRLARWRTDLASLQHRWWLALLEDEPVGVAGVSPSRDPIEEGLGELDTIAVLPNHWRKGVGRALIAVADAQLDEDYSAAILWTWTDYPLGEAFYTAVGWRPTDLRRGEGRQTAWRRP